MKYIRTKDGIFDKIDESLVLTSLPPKYELKKNGVFVKYEFCSTCQLADTIEELCDEFVSIKYGEHSLIITDGMAVKMGYEVYGAIWTDKGLIYVARMNEKGELELL